MLNLIFIVIIFVFILRQSILVLYIFALSSTFSYLTSILLLFTSIKFFNSLLIELRELNILQFAIFLLLKNVLTNLSNFLNYI